MSNAGVVGNTGWQAVRNSADIQFAPIPPAPPPPPNHPPEWLVWLGQALEWLFAPLGRAVGLSWPVVEKLLLGLAVAGVVLIAWRIMAMVWRRAATGDAGAASKWRPGPVQASQLLADADRLAAEGRFAEAVHLLLRRSVDHIAAARPDWLHPASTAREIAGLENLPKRAQCLRHYRPAGGAQPLCPARAGCGGLAGGA